MSSPAMEPRAESVADLLLSLRQSVELLALRTSINNPLSDSQLSDVSLGVQASLNRLRAAVLSWRTTSQALLVPESGKMELPLEARRMFQMLKDGHEGSKKLEAVKKSLGRIERFCAVEDQNRPGRSGKSCFFNVIEGLKGAIKEIVDEDENSGIECAVDFSEEADTAVAQINLGSHGKFSSFALVVDAQDAKDIKDVIVQVQVYFSVGENQDIDEDPSYESVVADLIRMLQEGDYDALKRQIKSILEMEILQDKFSGKIGSLDLIHLRKKMHDFILQYASTISQAAYLPTELVTQKLHGPAFCFFKHPISGENSKVVFTGAKEFLSWNSADSSSTNQNVGLLFTMDPGIITFTTVAAQFPSVYSNISRRQNPLPSTSSYNYNGEPVPNSLATMEAFMEGASISQPVSSTLVESMVSKDAKDRRNISEFLLSSDVSELYGERIGTFEVPDKHKIIKFLYRKKSSEDYAVEVKHVLLHPISLFEDFSRTIRLLRQQQCLNYLFSSCFTKVSSSGSKEAISGISQTPVLEVQLNPPQSLTLICITMKGMSSIQIHLDNDSALPTLQIEPRNSYTSQAEKILQETLSIPQAIAVLFPDSP